jgi:hypothetical protein
VRYEVELDLTNPVIECNCSHCQIKGLLLSFAPASFLTATGEEHLSEYRFNKHVIQHLFCKNCGVESFGRGTAPDGTDTVAVNVRTIDDIDLSKLQRTPFDGRSS